MCKGRKPPPAPLLGSVAGLRVKVTQDRLTGEKHARLFNIFYMDMESSEENKDLRKLLDQKLLSF